jgi:hypothetical protein
MGAMKTILNLGAIDASRTGRAASACARGGVIARAWTDVHFLTLPCPERAQRRRGLLGNVNSPLGLSR